MEKIITCELVRFLEQREGVKKIVAEPDSTKKITVEGPAIVFIIVD